ncbi:MAG: amino acid ABC transporter permease [Acidimicrobiales bacterium]
MSWQSLRFIATGIGATLLITAAAFLIGSILGVVITIARRSSNRLISALGRVWVEIIRSAPPVVWLFLVFFGLPQAGVKFSPLVAAIFTFGLVASTYISEIYRSGLSSIGVGQFEASAAVGLSSFDSARFIIVPQVFRVIGPTMATYAIGLLKDSALASTIGVVDLAFRASLEYQRTGQGLTIFGIVGLIYLLLSLPLAVVSRRVDSRLRARFSVA